MLTSYWVRCPHLGCHWQGSLLPLANAEPSYGLFPTRTEVVFECPRCQGEWHARIVGDDVKPLEEVTLFGANI